MADGLVIIGDHDVLARQACEIARLCSQPFSLCRETPVEAQRIIVALDDADARAEIVACLPRNQVVNLIHPHAFVSADAELGINVLVGANAIIGTNAKVGDGVVANALSSIEHDNVIGAYTFLGTGAILCGNVTTGERVFVGGGATVKPGTCVGAGTTLGAGAVLVKDADPDSVYVGNPARKLG